MSSAGLDTDHVDDVYIIRFDRPDRRNALTPEMFERLANVLVDPRAEGRALVLCGAGNVFCGGFDLKLCSEDPDALRHLLIHLSDTVRLLRSISMPVVIAAHGAAIAGGCALLGGADIVVTDKNAKLGYPVTPLGISPAVSAPSLADLIGYGATRERMLDPGLITGAEAYRIGLAHECVDTPEEVLPEARRIAKALAATPRFAWSETKRWLCEIDETHARAHSWRTTPRERALAASLSIADSAEERQRLQAMFARR